MDLYINSVGVISSAGNNMNGDFSTAAIDKHQSHVFSIEPDYKEYIPVMQLRRMSKAVRMGVVASKIAMQQAGVEQPDAISVGTAYGCLQDTEKFLEKMVEQEEQMLTPTAFIQSTHNTVSGQIALLSKCNAHNLTFVHRGHSFEHALIDAQLYISQNPDAKVLVGGIEELTENSVRALRLGGVKDTLGEGATFFIVSGKPLSDKYARIKNLEVFTSNDKQSVKDKFEKYINKHEKSALILSGVHDFSNAARFKHLCGDYPVASAFALGLLFESIDSGKLPDSCYTGENKRLNNVVLINSFCDYHSCWSLELSV